MSDLTEGRIRGIVREEMERTEKDFEARMQEAVASMSVEVTGEVLENMVNEKLHAAIQAMRGNLSEAMGTQHVEAMKAAIIQGMREALAEGATAKEAVDGLEREFKEPEQ